MRLPGAYEDLTFRNIGLWILRTIMFTTIVLFGAGMGTGVVSFVLRDLAGF